MDENNIIQRIKEKVQKLTKADAKIRIDKLYKEAEYHSNLYYNQDTPEITDFEYDMLTQEIRQIEEKYPDLKQEKTAVNKVGGTASNLFEKVNLEVNMQSLLDVFSIGEVFDWTNKISDEASKRDNIDNVEYVVETKIDGLSVSLTYENGKLTLATTRGDGIIGENITENIEVVDSIPKEIPYNGKIILRGEVYISKKDFENIVKKQEENGEKTFVNPRNAAAGTLRQKDKDKIKERNLRIYVFNVQYSDKKFDNHYESLEFVKSLGIDVNKYVKKISSKNSDKEIQDAIEEIHEMRQNFAFEIDGAVIKVDNLELRKELGETAKTPRWAIAYKYPAEQKETVVKDIIVNVARTGALTPVAELETVFVDGSSISRASLHNFDILKEKDVRIGDHVIIQKAGDIIPEVVRVLKEKRTDQKEFVIPTKCPVCMSDVRKENIAIFCTNEYCPSKVKRSIEHFASRNAMNIDGFAEKNIEILLEKDLIHKIEDIYLLKEEDFLGLKKDGKVYARNMINSINKSKENSLHRLINGLGIPNIGTVSAKKIAKEFKNIENLINAKEEDLVKIPDIGEVVAKSIVDFFKNEKNIETINKLKELGVNVIEPEDEKTNKLNEQVFVITGSFDIKRSEIQDMVEQNGGKVSSAVSTKTDYLIAGEKAGSKLEKAKELNTNIISLEELQEMIK